MSGGALDYVCYDVYTAKDIAETTERQEQLLDDIGGLLHDLEWSMSGDYAAGEWEETLEEFCEEWKGDDDG